MTSATGSILAARYQLAAPLGQGGMGQVWAATHLLTGRAVALKQLLAVPAGKSSRDARARFLLEAQSACAVDHPHVVQVLDFVDEHDQPPFLVMELLQGETLASKLERESVLGLEETLRLLLPVLSAAGAAHARGIIHRDLKPSNIFLHAGEHALGAGQQARPVVKVLDFGIAKWLEGDRLESGSRTQTGSTLGTPRYMSPEQATAERNLDHRTDIWSIGVMLYECLSGALPVDGENAAQMVMRLLSSGIIPIEQLVPSLPTELSRLIGRMLARDPDDRPQDLEEPFALLSRLSGEPAPSFGKPRQPASVRPTPTLEPALPEPALPAPVPPGASPEATWPPVTRPPEAGSEKREPPPARRRPGRFLSLALLLAGVALGAGLLLRLRGTAAPALERPRVPATAAAVALAIEVPARPPLPAPSPEPTAAVSAAVAAAVSAPAPKLGARPAPKAPKQAQARGRPGGAECDRSSDCASRACVAFACQ